MGAITKKGMGFVFFLIVMAVVGAMTLLGTDGSLIVYELIHGLVTWAPLMSLALALGIVGIFGGKKLGLY